MIAITLPNPVGVNGLYANTSAAGRAKMKARGRTLRGRIKTEAYTRWCKAADDVLWVTRGVRPVPGRIEVAMLFEESLISDLDGKPKGILDWLCRHNLIDGDSGAVVRKITLGWHAGPGCSVIVRKASDG